MVRDNAIVHHLRSEKIRVAGLARIREIIFGFQDGLITTLGVISTTAGAFADNKVVIVVGLEEAVAGAFSMATGAYLSSQAEKDVLSAEILQEKDQIRRHPQVEIDELVELFKLEHLKKSDAKLATQTISHSNTSFLQTMVEKEFGIDPRPASSPIMDGIYIGISYIIAALIPILPYFFLPTHQAIVPSVILGVLALFLLGIYKAQVAKSSYVRSGFKVLLFGIISSAGGYFLGKFITDSFGK